MDDYDKNDNNNSRRTKAIAAIPMAGILVAAALLSGLLSFTGSSYQPGMAQQNMTGTTGATTGGGVGRFGGGGGTSPGPGVGTSDGGSGGGGGTTGGGSGGGGGTTGGAAGPQVRP